MDTGLFVTAGVVAVLTVAGLAEASDLRIPLTVHNFSSQASPEVPVWTGLPFPKGAVPDTSSLRLLDENGRVVPAQFDVLARWSDGSAKWVLVSFFSDPPAGGLRRYRLVKDAELQAALPSRPVRIDDDTNDCFVSTGPIRIHINKHGFGGLSQVWLDIDGDGKFSADEMICFESLNSGIVAVDEAGREYFSRLGRVSDFQIEMRGPVHAVLTVKGDIRSRELPSEPLLEYAMRIHCFAGSGLVRVVLTVRNPRPSGRADDGSRWVLGQSGSVLLKSLDFVLPVRLPEPLRRVTLCVEPGRMYDRIPLTGPMAVYQDSSGGENWFTRTHVNRDNIIPLRFRGYKVYYHDRQIEAGLRASPWLAVADMRWAAGVAVPRFWQNFPKSLEAAADGTVKVGLWPDRFADLHEIQGGEQKTHEFWLYFMHRRGGRAGRMPYLRQVLPLCLERPVVWADSQWYADSGLFEPFVPYGVFTNYDAVLSAAVRGQTNLYTHREAIDEYGWRNFGDTWAANEHDKTGSPFDGLGVISHYNNEYDLGYGMLKEALRCATAEPALAKAWWDLALEALWHEADIDIYHTKADPRDIYNGGKFTHTAHGVEAGRSTHRGSPRDELWGLLDWPWGRGSCPESGHFRTQGQVYAYLLTGDRHLLDSAWDLTELVAMKVRTGRFAQIDVPDRCAAFNLQILLDAYLLTWDRQYRQLCEKIVENLQPAAVAARSGGRFSIGSKWQLCLYLKSLGRYVELLGREGEDVEAARDEFLEYCRLLAERCLRESGGRWGRDAWAWLLSDVMVQAAELTGHDERRAQFMKVAAEAFEGLLKRHVGPDGRAAFWNSKALTILMQGGGRYLRHLQQKNHAADSANQRTDVPGRS